MRIFKQKKIKRLQHIRVLKFFILVFIIISSLYLAGKAFDIFGASNNDLVLDLTLSADNYDAASRTFYDQSVYDHHGVSANDAVFLPGQYGESEGAMSFNGVNDYIDFGPDTLNMGLNDMTISTWVKRGSSNYAFIFSKSKAAGQTHRYWLDIQSNGVVRFGSSWASSGHYDFLGTKALTIGEWYHVTVTIDRDAYLKIFVNNELDVVYDISQYENVDMVSNNPFRIGSYTASNNITPMYFFEGELRNLRIYDRVLDANEITDLYNEHKPRLKVASIEKGLIGHWSLDGTHYNETTNRVTDSSAFANHATNYGAVLATDRYGKSNGAMSINGANSRIAVSYQNPIYQTSVAAWFKSNGAPIGGYHIITGGASVEISINSSGYIRTGVVTNTQGRRVFNSGSGLTDGNWHQVAFTYDGVNLKSFIDGELTATNPVSGTLTGTAQEIGRYLSNSYIANGIIDDVRIYNRAISEEEIRLLYDSNSAETVSGSLQKGLVLDIPLTAKYTKGGSSGAEIMTDTTPYSNDGENHGANISLDGAQFDGISDYIVSENNIGSAGSSPRTISVWFYPQAQRTQNLLGYGAEGTGRLFDIYLSANGQIAGHFYSGGYDTLGSDSPIYSLNEWQHFAISYDGSKAYIYYNGEYYKEKELALNTGTSKLFIGKGVWGSPAQFYGKISNVKIYNRALNNTEIETLYDYGSSGAAAILGGA